METDVLQTSDPDALRQIAVAAWRRAQQLEKASAALAQEKAELAQEKAELAQEKAELEAKNAALETETGVLLAQIAELTKQLAQAKSRDVQLELDLQLRKLRERLASANQEAFGSKSERRGRGERKKKDDKEQTGHGPTDQPDLEREQQVLTLDEADLCCPKCAGDLRVMAEQFESSELIVSVRRTYKLREVKRQKYHCGGCGHIDTAPGPLKLIPGGRYDLSFTVQVAIDKYLDALPLERQVQRMQRVGLNVTTQALWDQLHALYLVLLPTLVALKAKVLEELIVHADETPWRQMNGKGRANGKRRSSKWWLWTLTSAAGVYFELLPSRGLAAAQQLFDGYDGIVVADAYTVYRSLENALTEAGGEQLDLDGNALPLPNYTLACCWMHARRPLFKAEKDAPEVGEALDLIAELYAVEDEAKRLADGDPSALLDHRRRLRASKSADLISRLALWKEVQVVLPETKLAKAVGFLDNHWERLTRFLADPHIPLDNGEAERAIRRPVLGRKNFYGTRSDRGARVAAALFSLLGTCTKLGVEPGDYLLEATKRALRDPGTVYLPKDHLLEQSADSTE